jgi:hypothetical protein
MPIENLRGLAGSYAEYSVLGLRPPEVYLPYKNLSAAPD